MCSHIFLNIKQKSQWLKTKYVIKGFKIKKDKKITTFR